MSKYGMIHNFVINSCGTVANIALSLITVPLYIHAIGEARYGVLSIVWLLLGYLGFLDLGLSRAATNSLAKMDSAQLAERTEVLAASILLNLVLGIIGAVFLFFVGTFLLEHIIQVPSAIKPEIANSLPWISVLLPLALVSGVATGSLEAREKFKSANVLQVLGLAIGQIVPVACAIYAEPTLTVVIPAAVLSRAAGVLITCIYVASFNGPWSFGAIRLRTATNLLNYGGWVTISSIISPLLQSLDQVMIGSTLNVASVTYYSVPMNLVLRSQLFAVALARSLFPRLSRSNQFDSRAISSRSLVLLAYGYGFLCAPGILVAPTFLSIWIGQHFSNVASHTMQLLLLGGWINGLAFIPFSLLQAQGRPDLPAKFHLAEIVPFVAILWLCLHFLGVYGAAAAWTLRVVFDALLLSIFARIDPKALFAILPLAAFLASCCIFSFYVEASALLSLMFAALAAVLVLLLAFKFIASDLSFLMGKNLLVRRRATANDDLPIE